MKSLQFIQTIEYILSDLGSQLFQHKENEKGRKNERKFHIRSRGKTTQKNNNKRRGQNWTFAGMKSNTFLIE